MNILETNHIMSKTYSLRIKEKDTGSQLSFSIPASSMAEAVGKLVAGKQKTFVETGKTKGGQTKGRMEKFLPKGQYQIEEAYTHGIEYPELIGRTV